MATLQELQQKAFELFKLHLHARNGFQRKIETAHQKCLAVDKEKAEAIRDEETWKKALEKFENSTTGDASAKEVGEAFIAVREAMSEGTFTPWCRATVKGGINHVNYCMRVAEGKSGKEIRAIKAAEAAKKYPHKPVIENLTKELNQLMHLVARGNLEKSDQLLDSIIKEVKTLYSDTKAHCKKIAEEHKALTVKLREAEKTAEVTKKLVYKKEREIRLNFRPARAAAAGK